jgi:hypothetical protein
MEDWKTVEDCIVGTLVDDTVLFPSRARGNRRILDGADQVDIEEMGQWLCCYCNPRKRNLHSCCEKQTHNSNEKMMLVIAKKINNK